MADRGFDDGAFLVRLQPLVWTAGSLMVLMLALLGGSSSRTAMLALDGVAWTATSILWLRGRLPGWVLVASQYLAISIVTGLVIASDRADTPAALFYLWVAVQGAYFNDWRSALHQGIVATLGYAVALEVVADGAFPVAMFLVLSGTLFAVGALVGLLRHRVHALVGHLNRLAETDELTGLGNRRRLMGALAEVVAHSTPAAPATIALFDLDGFKLYNDTYGHPAGDALLSRLADRLDDGPGSAFRLGGDEFCVIVRGAAAARTAAIERATAALAERGEGFSVTASVGTVELPAEADSTTGALSIADRRLYQQKALRRGTSAQIASRASRRRSHDEVRSALARRVGVRLGIGGEDLDVLVRAVELQDLGKIALPDEILRQGAPLTEAEHAFVREYVRIGERLLDASPPLREVANVVRASQERWDGSGYPEGMRGEEIPLLVRIVSACTALRALTAGRPHAAAVSLPQAVAELRRGAGTQFDPTVVDALLAELDEDDLVALIGARQAADERASAIASA